MSGSGVSESDGDLADMFEQGREAWPSVAVDRAAFYRFVTERAAAPGDRARLRGADLYLAFACSCADPSALAEFEARYLRDLAGFLARYNPTPRYVDDVRQQVRERLFVAGKIKQFSGQGSLASWVRVVTVRVASNMRQQDKRHVNVDDVVSVDDVALGTAIDPELRVIQERYGQAFREALRDAIAGLQAEDRNLIRLHYLDGLNIGKIGVFFHVARATVGRRVKALRERILNETYRLLCERLKATPSEIDSLLRLVHSRLDVSLSDALRET